MDYKKLIAQELAKTANISQEDLVAMIEVPSNREMGDFALPCFKLSKVLRKSPMMIADELKEAYQTDDNIDRVESVKGYLNFFLNKQNDGRQVLDAILAAGDMYGADTIGNGSILCIRN